MESVLDYLHHIEEQGQKTDSVRASLRWFFKSAAVQSGLPDTVHPERGTRQHVIELERPDAGLTAWEKRLVTAIRRRHLQWRTEQTYRGWARRFAVWLEGRPVEEASAADIREYGFPIPWKIKSPQRGYSGRGSGFSPCASWRSIRAAASSGVIT